MRYKRYKTAVSKLCDVVIDDNDEIRNLVRAICEKNISCQLCISNECPYDDVRIISIQDNDFTWRTMKNRSSLLKTSLYTNIDQIIVNTQAEEIARVQNDPSRWMLLDPDINQ